MVTYSQCLDPSHYILLTNNDLENLYNRGSPSIDQVVAPKKKCLWHAGPVIIFGYLDCKSQPEYCLNWLRFIVGFLRSSRQMSG